MYDLTFKHLFSSVITLWNWLVYPVSGKEKEEEPGDGEDGIPLEEDEVVDEESKALWK